MDIIEEFPDDGVLRFIRWFDNIRPKHGRTSGPSVEVSLCTLPSNVDIGNFPRISPPLLSGAVEFLPRPEVSTGMIPGLAIGGVFCGKRRIGRLAENRKRFLLKDLKATILTVKDTNPAPAPQGWDPKYQRNVLGPTAYQVGHSFLSSNCLLLDGISRGIKTQVVLPCPEVFRAIYGPHRWLALQLTSGDWEYARKKLINPDRTLIVADDWQVGLRKNTDTIYATLLGCLELTEEGIRAVNDIYNGLLRPNADFGQLRVGLPFKTADWTNRPNDLSKPCLSELDIEIDAYSLRPNSVGDRWLGTRITGLIWPEAPVGPARKIHYCRDNSSDEGADEVTTVDDKKPFNRPNEHFGSDPLDGIDVDGTTDPSDGSDPIKLSFEGPKWGNEPELIETVKPKSKKYLKASSGSLKENVSKASPGPDVPGKQDAAIANYEAVQHRNSSERFQHFFEMLEVLVTNQLIDGLAVVSPPTHLGGFRGNLRVWHFPKKVFGDNCPWSTLDRTPPKTQRSLFVCSVRNGLKTIHCLEIELRPWPKERGLASFFFEADSNDVEPLIHQLLEICAAFRGNWTKDLTRLGKISLKSFVTWKHHYGGQKTPNHLSAFRCLQKLFLAKDDVPQ